MRLRWKLNFIDIKYLSYCLAQSRPSTKLICIITVIIIIIIIIIIILFGPGVWTNKKVLSRCVLCEDFSWFSCFSTNCYRILSKPVCIFLLSIEFYSPLDQKPLLFNSTNIYILGHVGSSKHNMVRIGARVWRDQKPLDMSGLICSSSIIGGHKKAGSRVSLNWKLCLLFIMSDLLSERNMMEQSRYWRRYFNRFIYTTESFCLRSRLWVGDMVAILVKETKQTGTYLWSLERPSQSP